MSNLHPCIRGNGGNNFCGPAALVSAFGIDVADATAAIRKASGKAKTFGVRMSHLEAAMEQFGTPEEVEEVCHPDGLMRPWHGSLEKLAPLLDPGIYVLAFNNHYITLDTKLMEVCDNHTIYPLPLSRYRLRRKRVVKIWLIREVN